MSQQRDTPLSIDDLQRYVDGVLPETQREQAEAWLAANPDDRVRVQQLRGMNAALHADFDQVLTEPIPARLTRELKRPVMPKRMLLAATVAALSVGTLIGWVGRAWMDSQRAARMQASSPAQAWPRQAILAHAAYTPEIRHPVEVTAKEEEHLFAWLSKRVGAPIRHAKLSEQGFELMGGRMLPGENGAVAQFMYQNATGKRLTLMVTRKQNAGTDTAFRFYDERGIGVFYWVDGPFGYAISGDIPRSELLTIANAVYKQLNP